MPMTENNFISFWNKADKGENDDFKAWNAKVGLAEQWKKPVIQSIYWLIMSKIISVDLKLNVEYVNHSIS